MGTNNYVHNGITHVNLQVHDNSVCLNGQSVQIHLPISVENSRTKDLILRSNMRIIGAGNLFVSFVFLYSFICVGKMKRISPQGFVLITWPTYPYSEDNVIAAHDAGLTHVCEACIVLLCQKEGFC